MTASKRRNHPSILQVPSISSLFSVLPRVILGKTQRNKTCQSSAISPHNQPISREYPLSLSTSFSVYFLRSSYERTREGSPSLESSHSSTSLAMNEGLTPGCLSFADHFIKCQYTKIILSNANIRRSSYDNGHRTDNILLSSANRQTRMEGAEINKSLLALKECIR